MKFVTEFSHISLKDSAQVGAKAASLGHLYTIADQLGINVPNGFSITTQGYWYFVNSNGILPQLHAHMQMVDYGDIKTVQTAGAAIRDLFYVVRCRMI